MAARTPADLKAEYERTVESVRNNKQLSDAGKRQRIARAYQLTTKALAALQAAAAASSESERRALEAKFVGPGMAPLGATSAELIARESSFRSALQTATTTDSDGGQLAALLQRSKAVGDTLMTRAALTVAVERSDVDAINVWLEDQPAHIDRYMNRLFELQTSKDDLRAEMVTAMKYGMPAVPGELAHMTAAEIADAATNTVPA